MQQSTTGVYTVTMSTDRSIILHRERIAMQKAQEAMATRAARYTPFDAAQVPAGLSVTVPVGTLPTVAKAPHSKSIIGPGILWRAEEDAMPWGQRERFRHHVSAAQSGESWAGIMPDAYSTLADLHNALVSLKAARRYAVRSELDTLRRHRDRITVKLRRLNDKLFAATA